MPESLPESPIENSPGADFALPLRDVIAPVDPGWWPPAPGWWVLAVLGVGVSWFLFRWLKPYLVCLFTYEFAALKKSARRELHDLIRQDELSDQQWVTQLSSLLKRVALQRFPEQNVAKLSGQQWFDFLAETSQGRAFSESDLKRDLQAQYQLITNIDRQGLIQNARAWLSAL